MGKSLPIYMSDVPTYSVEGNHMHIVWRELEIVLPVSTMLQGMASAREALAKWQVDQLGRVVPLGRLNHL
jgi:hypothetical protein